MTGEEGRRRKGKKGVGRDLYLWTSVRGGMGPPKGIFVINQNLSLAFESSGTKWVGYTLGYTLAF